MMTERIDLIAASDADSFDFTDGAADGPERAGDSGAVNAADYVIWRDKLGVHHAVAETDEFAFSGDPTDAAADHGALDGGDYVVWRKYDGAESSTGNSGWGAWEISTGSVVLAEDTAPAEEVWFDYAGAGWH